MSASALAFDNSHEMASVLPFQDEANKSSLFRPQLKLEDLMDNVQMNPVIAASSALLAGLLQLKHHPVCEDMHVLQQDLIKEIVKFEAKAKQYNLSETVANDARYILCACFDEVILNYCSDKSGSDLAQSSLISVFYHETSGGENAFVLLDKLLRNPSANIDLIELFSLCLSLGFEGKYRVMSRGFDQLGILRDQVWRCIREQRGDYQKQLFAETQVDTSNVKNRKKFSLGIIAGATALALFLVGFAFNYALDQNVNPVVQTLQQL